MESCIISIHPGPSRPAITNMNSDVVLLGFACIAHYDYRQPVSWTNQRQHHQDGNWQRSFCSRCVARTMPCSSRVLHATLVAYIALSTAVSPRPFRLLVLLLQPAAALPRTSPYTHARNGLSDTSRMHTNVHNIHNSSASIHTHIHTHIAR